MRGVVLFHGALRPVDTMWLGPRIFGEEPLYHRELALSLPGPPRASVNARHILVSQPCSTRRFNSPLRSSPSSRAARSSALSAWPATAPAHRQQSPRCPGTHPAAPPPTRPSRHGGTITTPIPRTAGTPLAFSSSSGPTADSSAGTPATISPVITCRDRSSRAPSSRTVNSATSVWSSAICRRAAASRARPPRQPDQRPTATATVEASRPQHTTITDFPAQPCPRKQLHPSRISRLTTTSPVRNCDSTVRQRTYAACIPVPGLPREERGWRNRIIRPGTNGCVPEKRSRYAGHVPQRLQVPLFHGGRW